MRRIRDALAFAWPPFWLGVLIGGLAFQVLALLVELIELPTDPVGAALHGTLNWLCALILIFSIDIHTKTFGMFLSKPRNLRVVRDGVIIPARLVDLGRDPLGARSWMITNVIVEFGDELRAVRVPDDAAIYFLNGEGDLCRLRPPGQDDDDEMS